MLDTDDRFPVGSKDREVLPMPHDLAEEWELVRRFMPIEDSHDPIVVASIAFVDKRGFVANGEFDDGRGWAVQPLLFGRALLGVWRDGVSMPGTHDDTWEFSNVVLAVIAAGEWGGRSLEPRWWTRHPGSGRRRRYNPDGSALEYRLVDG